MSRTPPRRLSPRLREAIAKEDCISEVVLTESDKHYSFAAIFIIIFVFGIGASIVTKLWFLAAVGLCLGIVLSMVAAQDLKGRIDGWLAENPGVYRALNEALREQLLEGKTEGSVTVELDVRPYDAHAPARRTYRYRLK